MQTEATSPAVPATMSWRRGLRFSLRSMLLVTLGLAVWLGYRERERNVVDRKLVVRQSIANELMRRHWATMDGGLLTPTGRALAIIEKELSTSTHTVNLEVLKAAPDIMHMHPKEQGALDQVEREALSRLDQGETEIWDIDWKGSVRYFGTLKGSATCHSCHTRSLYSNPVPGTELAVIRVDIQ